NTLLLFLLLRSSTGAHWRSAIVAAFFGLHPLHVESVAWISERKDVLSGFFFMLTLLAYVNYVKKSKAQGLDFKTTTHHSPNTMDRSVSYALALVFFAAGLMSKPMVVTLPFVMLLLDYWPLNRFIATPNINEQSPTTDYQIPLHL